MLYSEIRSEMKSGDVVAWSGNSPFSKLIKWWCKSKYTHVGIIYCTPTRIFIIESKEGFGVRIFPLSRTIPFYWIKTNLDWNINIEEFMMKHIGDRYSWIGCIKAGLGIVTRKDRRWECAEFVNYIFKCGGLRLPCNCQTPAKVVDFFISSKKEINYVRDIFICQETK